MAKTLRLYQITDTVTRKPVPGLFFADKMAAKRKRQELNKSSGIATEVVGFLRFVVSPGPDHRNFRG